MNTPLWKPLLIILVIAGCGTLALTKGLKPGIDLAGGTTLVYDVLVPEGRDSEEVINDTIAIQRERVDSSGVKNLIWRAEAGDRLSVTMAQAGPEVQEARDAFDNARKALLANTLDANAVDAAVAMEDPAARQAEFERLAKGDPAVVQQLNQLAELVAQRDRARQPYTAANEAWQDAQSQVGEDPSTEEQAELDRRFNELNETAAAFSAARDAVDAQRQQVLARSVNAAEIDRILALSTEVRRNQDQSPRAEAVQRFKDNAPSLADAFQAMIDAWEAYEQVKGPLDDPEDLKRMLRGAGVLEFRIAASPDGQPVDVNTYVQRLTEKGPRAGLTEDYRWFKIQSLEQMVDERSVREQLQDDETTIGPYFASRRGLVGRGPTAATSTSCWPTRPAWR